MLEMLGIEIFQSLNFNISVSFQHVW